MWHLAFNNKAEYNLHTKTCRVKYDGRLKPVSTQPHTGLKPMPNNVLKKATFLLTFDQALKIFPLMLHFQCSQLCSVLIYSVWALLITFYFYLTDSLGAEKPQTASESGSAQRPVRMTLCWEYITEPPDKDGASDEVFSTTQRSPWTPNPASGEQTSAYRRKWCMAMGNSSEEQRSWVKLADLLRKYKYQETGLATQIARAPVQGGQYTEGCKEWQATQEEFINIAKACRDGVRKAEAHLELTLASNVEGNKKSFCYYIGCERLNKKMWACCWIKWAI